MAIALRCLAIAALGILVLPAAALANATVEPDTTFGSGLLTITDAAGAADTITVTNLGASFGTGREFFRGLVRDSQTDAKPLMGRHSLFHRDDLVA